LTRSSSNCFRAVAAATVLLAAAGCGSAPPGTPAATASASQFPSPEPLPGGTPGKLPVSLPAPATVDDTSATAVSRAAVIIEWTMDTVTDTSQYQAELRSAPFLAPAYLAALQAAPPVAAPGAQWDQWASHRAYTTVALRAEHDDPPPDTPVLAHRQWGITVTPRGPRVACPRPQRSAGKHPQAGARHHRGGSPKAAHRNGSTRRHPSTPQCGWTGNPVTATVFVTLTRSGSGAAWRVSAITVSS
jgi:hypothetical protein